jgi:hypothetical protein
MRVVGINLVGLVALIGYLAGNYYAGMIYRVMLACNLVVSAIAFTAIHKVKIGYSADAALTRTIPFQIFSYAFDIVSVIGLVYIDQIAWALASLVNSILIRNVIHTAHRRLNG